MDASSHRPNNRPVYLGKPGNPAMAILPKLELRDDTPRARQIDFDTNENIVGEPRKHGVTRPVPITSAPVWRRQITDPNYIDGNMAIARFDGGDWPSATSTIAEMLREVLSRLVRRIDMGQ
jgi:hypothetical protein